MPLDKGQVINQRYRIVGLLGQGGFGAVYRAWDMNLSRPCALKENLEISDEARRQFEREAQILANLNHPGLPRVIDHFVISGQGQYLVMDYIEGEDLHQVMEKTGGPLPESQAVAWVLQVCDALNYLHTQTPPVIHRDIKPANIKITPQDRAVLVDFGIAKIYDPKLRTTSGARAVTPGYSPPEQYGQGQTDAQSDVYALGATLYNLLTGTVPTDSVDVVAGNAPPPPPVIMLNPKISPVVSTAVMRAMNTNKALRLHSMREFQAALQGRLSSPPEMGQVQTRTAPVGRRMQVSPVAPVYPASDRPASSGRPVEPPPPAPRPFSVPAQSDRRKIPWLAILGGAALLFVVGIVGIFILASVLAPSNKTPEPSNVALGNTPQKATKVPTSLSTDTRVSSATLVPSATPVPTDTPQPSATPTPSGPTPVLYSLPQSRLAFVSDHRMDGKERIYIIDITGGSYTSDQLTGLSPFSQPAQLPALEPYNMAWWPDWCGGNQTVFFEVQDMNDPNFQTVAFVSSSGSGSAASLTLPGVAKLGVPRCSNSGTQVLLSALTNSSNNKWELYRYDMSTQNSERVGNGYSLAGYSSWSRDDSWLVYMDKNSQGDFYLIRMILNPFGTNIISIPSTIVDQKYPAVSPATGEIIFACFEDNRWNLCRVDESLGNYRVILNNLVDTSKKRAAPKRPIAAITPTWSPDGMWIAYASNKDGDWDIYLYSSILEIEVNLTQGLGGDQFQPAWSKP
jgi:serine/threonine protein kinase